MNGPEHNAITQGYTQVLTLKAEDKPSLPTLVSI
jgi:hypothetical protein